MIGLCNEERECRSPRGDASIGTLCSRGNSHCVDREFSFYDLALIALAARKSRKIKRGSRGSREPSKFPHTMPGLGQASLRASNFSAANWRKGRVRRSAKGPPFDATECDAQHKNAASQTAKPPAPPTLSGFAFVPHTCRFLGRHPSGCRTGSEEAEIFTSPPLFRSARGRPVRRGKISAPVTARLRKRWPRRFHVEAKTDCTHSKGDVQQLHCLMPEKVGPQRDKIVSKPLDSLGQVIHKTR